MKIGDLVRIVSIPDHLSPDEVLELELCEGLSFPIRKIDELLTLEIGEAVSEDPRSLVICIKPELVELV